MRWAKPRTRAARVQCLLLLAVLVLTAFQYLCGFMSNASPLKIYLYRPFYNTTQPTIRVRDSTFHWPKELSVTAVQTENPNSNKCIQNATVLPVITKNITNIQTFNMARQNVSDYTNTPLLINKLKENMKNFVTTGELDARKNESALPLCEIPPDLGPVPVNKTEVDLDWVEKKYPEVHWGGRYAPPNCTARHKVAIIVPYRDRKAHLEIFLNHLHPFLMKQQIEYGIFIIEQEGNSDFNRAKLMNVGFVESQKQKAGGWQCFIFHDVDLLPLDLRNMYSCPRQPRHLSASIDRLNFTLPYEEYFGGVSALTLEQFTKVNGFSNKYWGWGGEDDDMYCRLEIMNYHIARYKMSIARYASLDHKKSVPSPIRYHLCAERLAKIKTASKKDSVRRIKQPITARHWKLKSREK